MVRSRIADAGFTDVEVIHLGADKVFVRSLAGLDVVPMLENAREFFNYLFSSWERWEDKGTPFHRGAWVRLYGIPLHAWNESFFKLCVFDCGRFLRADNYTLDKDRLDFARVLIATSSLEVVKRVERLMVDDTIVEVQVIEEWGYDMGDDACLLVDDRAVEASLYDRDEDRRDPETSHHVDKMVEDFADELAKAAGSALHRVGDKKHVNMTFENPLLEERPDRPKPVLKSSRAIAGVSTGSCGVNVDWVAETVATSLESPGQARVGVEVNRPARVAHGSGNQRARSCPPGVRSPASSGPWSWEWLQDHTHEHAGVIFSSKKRAPNSERPAARQQRLEHNGAKKRQGGGPLCHALFSLKRIARLPRRDRRQVLTFYTKMPAEERIGEEPVRLERRHL
jgi:hypothetical protein